MIKTRKYFLKDIEITKKLENGETSVSIPNTCFSEDSFVVIKIPSNGDKMRLQQKMKDSKDPLENYKMICEMLETVSAKTLDTEEEIDNLDDLTMYVDGGLVVQFITEILSTGIVPKKKLTV